MIVLKVSLQFVLRLKVQISGGCGKLLLVHTESSICDRLISVRNVVDKERLLLLHSLVIIYSIHKPNPNIGVFYKV